MTTATNMNTWLLLKCLRLLLLLLLLLLVSQTVV
jgi:hypothetical protein